MQVLGLDSNTKQSEAGRLGAELLERRRDVAAKIKSRKKEAITRAADTAAELATRAAQGDPGALAEVVAIVRSQPLAFPPELDEAVVAGMAQALSEVADTFVESLLPETKKE
jgi:hypothetical protein